MIQKKGFYRMVAMLVATFSVASIADPKFPWLGKPDTSGRPTPEQPDVRPKPALDQIPGSCATSLSNPNYRMLAEKLSRLASNTRIVRQLERYGLSVQNVSWQDTGRSDHSSGGYNISDVRLVAITKDRTGKTELFSQPIVRLPNFEDVTVDINLEEVMVPVGNSWGLEKPFAVPLKLLLENPQPFLSFKEKLKHGSLLAERDSQVLVSAQASIMPVPENGQADFVPSIYNYSSSQGNPAVMVILVSNLGTSITIIDNERDPASDNGMSGSGQLLFHNKNGEKSPFTLQALSAVTQTEAGKQKVADLAKSGLAVAGVSGVNQVLMIQVPLKHRQLSRSFGGGGLEAFGMSDGALEAVGRGLDTGVVGVADYTLGQFVEFDGLGGQLERDTTVPIRIDVVRYLATNTAELTPSEVERLPYELKGIYEAGSNLGSLVTDPYANRVTRNYRPWLQPWWNVVYKWLQPQYRQNPGLYFEPIYGPYWMYRFGSEESALATLATLKHQ